MQAAATQGTVPIWFSSDYDALPLKILILQLSLKQVTLFAFGRERVLCSSFCSHIGIREATIRDNVTL